MICKFISVVISHFVSRLGNQMNLSFIHARLANTVLLYFLAMMIWAFWLFFRKRPSDPNFRGAFLISEILVLLQGGMGLVLWLTHLRPTGGSMHVLYGVIAVLGLPALYVTTKDRPSRYEMLVYAVAYFLLAAIVVRSRMTG
jgi:heme A synthase